MTLTQALVLFLAGIGAGGLNALAGGGGFITLPALIWSGSSPILANTGGTIAVWPGLIAALFAYRRNLRGRKHPLTLYMAVAVIGSATGRDPAVTHHQPVFHGAAALAHAVRHRAFPVRQAHYGRPGARPRRRPGFSRRPWSGCCCSLSPSMAGISAGAWAS